MFRTLDIIGILRMAPDGGMRGEVEEEVER